MQADNIILILASRSINIIKYKNGAKDETFLKNVSYT